MLLFDLYARDNVIGSKVKLYCMRDLPNLPCGLAFSAPADVKYHQSDVIKSGMGNEYCPSQIHGDPKTIMPRCQGVSRLNL